MYKALSGYHLHVANTFNSTISYVAQSLGYPLRVEFFRFRTFAVSPRVV